LSDYDIVIIGSGVGGTAVGALLASKNLNTLLIEKNEIIGGRCSTYEKDGFKIDGIIKAIFMDFQKISGNLFLKKN
jgi:phytoene dehydrogenase-like protein